MTETSRQIADALNALEAAGFAAAQGLRSIAANPEPTRLNDIAMKYYQDGPEPVARVAEMLIDAGRLIDAVTDRWWPTQIDRLRALDYAGYTVRGNPPVVETRDAETGHVVTVRIGGPTQSGVDRAIAELRDTLRARQTTTPSARSWPLRSSSLSTATTSSTSRRSCSTYRGSKTVAR